MASSSAKHNISIIFEAVAKNFSQAKAEVDSALNTISKQIALVNAKANAYGESLATVTERHGLLNSQVEAGSKRIDIIAQALAQATEKWDANSETAQRLNRELIVAQTAQVRFKQALDESAMALKKFGGSASDLDAVKKSIEGIDASSKSLDKALKENDDAIKGLGEGAKGGAAHTALLAERQDLLTRRLIESKAKTLALESGMELLKKSMGENKDGASEASDSYKALEEELTKTKKETALFESGLETVTQELEKNLLALGKLESGMAGAGKSLRSFEEIEASSRRLDLALNENTASLGKLADGAEGGAERIALLSERKKLLASRLKDAQDKAAGLDSVFKGLNKQIEVGATNVTTASGKYQDLEGELSEARSKCSDLEGEMRDVDKAFKDCIVTIDLSSDGLKNLGQGVETAGRALSGVSRAASGFLKGVVDASIGFESAFTGVRKTVDATEGEFQKLSKAALHMSTVKPVSAEDIARIMELGGQLGISKDHLEDFAGVIADLDVSTDLNIETAAKEIAQFANITKMGQGDFEKFGSTLVALGNNFATTETDIMNMSMRLAGAGNQIGLSDAEILAFATTLSSLGLNAEAAGSAFSKVFTRAQMGATVGLEKFNEVSGKTGLSFKEMDLMMHNNNQGFKKLAQSLGMESEELKNVINGHKDLENMSKVSGLSMETFARMINGATLEEKDFAEISSVTGKSVEEVAAKFGDGKGGAAEAIAMFIDGLSASNDLGDSTNEMLSSMGITELRLADSMRRVSSNSDLLTSALDTGRKAWGENTALAKEAETRYGTTESKMAILKNQLKALAISLGDIVLPFLSKLVEKATPVVQSFGGMSDGSKTFALAAAGIVAGIAPALTGLGNLIQFAGSAKKGLQKLGNTFDAAEGVFKLLGKSAGVAASAVGAAGDAAQSSGGLIKGLVSHLDGVGGALATIGATAGVAILALAAIGIGAKLLYDKMSQELIPSFKGFGDSVSEGTAKAAEAFMGLKQDAQIAFDGISWGAVTVTKDMADKVTSSFKTMASATKQAIDEEFAKALDGIKKTEGLSAEARAKAQKTLEDAYKAKIAKVESAEKQITQIVENAGKEKRALTKDEVATVQALLDGLEETTVSSLSKTADEQHALLEAMKSSEGALTAQAAAEVAKNALQKRDSVIAAAKEEYEGSIAAADKLREQGTIAANRLADEVVAAATRQRKDRVDQANAECDETIDIARKKSGEYADAIDWTTGRVRTLWDKFKENMRDNFLQTHDEYVRDANGQKLWANATGDNASKAAEGFNYGISQMGEGVEAAGKLRLGVDSELMGLEKDGGDKGKDIANAVRDSLAKLPETASAEELRAAVVGKLGELAAQGDEKTKGLCNAAVSNIEAMAEGIGDSVAGMSDGAQQETLKLYDGVLGVLEGLQKNGGDKAKAFVDGVTSTLEGLPLTTSPEELKEKVLQSLDELKKKGGDKAKEFCKDIIKYFDEEAQAVASSSQQGGEAVAENIVGGANKAAEEVQQPMQQVQDSVSTTAEAVGSSSQQGGKAIESNFGDGSSKAAEKVEQANKSIQSGTTATSKTMQDETKKGGDAAAKNYGDGSSKAAEKVEQANKSIQSSTTATSKTMQDESQKGGDAAAKNYESGGKAIEGSVKSTSSAVKTGSEEMANNVKKGGEEAQSAAEKSFSGVKDSAEENFSKAARAAYNAVEEIKKAFSVTVQGPKIKLPVISVKGQFGTNPPEAPKFSLSWAAKGHVATGASILGVGEYPGANLNPELISPVSLMKDSLREVLIERADMEASSKAGALSLEGLSRAIESLALRPVSITVDGQEIARATAAEFDKASGGRMSLVERGLAI